MAQARDDDDNINMNNDEEVIIQPPPTAGNQPDIAEILKALTTVAAKTVPPAALQDDPHLRQQLAVLNTTGKTA